MSSRRLAKESKKEEGGARTGATTGRQKSGVSEDEKKKKKKKGSWWPVLKILGYFVFAILISTFLNYAVLNQESKALLPAGGVMYDIGWSQKLFMKCTGSGLPTVILDAPLGQSSDVWVMVEPILAKTTRVCVYDRAGLGFSDRAYQNTSAYSGDFSEAARQRDKALPSTAERMADDLHRLVSSSSNQPKPLLLVSSDFITFVTRFYAQVYEHEVGGLFLIDPAFEGLFSMRKTSESQDKITSWQDLWNKKILPFYQGKWLTSVIGFNRISLMLGLMSPVEDEKLIQVLDKDSITRKKHAMCKPRHLSAVFDEHFNVNESMAQVRTMMTVKPFPAHLPVTVATYQKSVGYSSGSQLNEDWKVGQDQMLEKLHPKSRRVVLPGSDYLTFYLNPKEVATPILEMVLKWRMESKLSA